MRMSSVDYMFSQVPNVPCGVERLNFLTNNFNATKVFLMYRVELKDFWSEDNSWG